MKTIITANELKVRGVKILESMKGDTEDQNIFISIRGVVKYAILPIEYFIKLREYEIEMAYKESIADIKARKFKEDSVIDHLEKVTK